MHHIYHTRGIILSSRGYGEAGKYYRILTPDFGLVFASAQGVRKLSSKLRFVLHDYAYVKIDLVRTRDFWRITNAEKTSELDEILYNKKAMRVFASVASLLTRLISGEEENEKLFFSILEGLKVLQKETDPEKIKNIEIILVLRILHQLGYVGAGENTGEALSSPFSELAYSFSTKRMEVLRQINKILRTANM